MNAALKDKLKTLPASPGVYFHKAENSEVIYVGKAAVLKNRVRQYFQSGKDFDAKTRALVAEIYTTDWIETESEVDALFLESEMIKRYMPRYNILLRDDKSQTFIRIDMSSDWPTVTFTRNPLDDGARYFGPFYNSLPVKKALRLLRRVFPYFTQPPMGTRRSQLNSQLGLEPPLDMTSEEYKQGLKRLIRYIKGNRVTLVRELEAEMKRAAKAEQFETAAILRNKITNLKELQRRIMFGDHEFLNISKDNALMQLRELLGLRHAPQRIEGYDVSHISGQDVVASMVVFTNGVSDRANYRKFKLHRQQNDDYANMREILARRLSPKNIKAWGSPDLLLIDGGKGQLRAALDVLDALGLAIPCISIAKRDEEMLVHQTRSHVDTSKLDDLMSRPEPGVYVAHEGEMYTVNLHVGKLNAGSHSKNLRGGETLSRYSDLTKLFQRIRDESHRFAISYHTTLQRGRQTKSAIEDIPGIGPATRKKLIRKFGSLRGVKLADQAALVATVGTTRALAIKKYFE